MKRALLILAAAAPLAFAQSTTFTASYGGLPIPIPPSNNNAYAAVRILMPKSLIIQSVTVTMDVTYPNVSDLNVFLYSPQATRTKLLEHNCGGNPPPGGPLANIDTTFDDTATTMFSNYCPATPGQAPFQGNEPLGNSKGQNSLGYWLLAVQNNVSQNSGFVNSASITITGTVGGPPAIVPQTIVSSSSFKSGSVSPGELISVYGANLGPATPVSATGTGNLPTSLGGTTVTFDGTPVPLIYVSSSEVSIETPVTLISGQSTSIQVSSTFGQSNSVTLPIVPARPGIFTVESGGAGQARAINQDGTTNGDGTVTAAGSDVPAPAGTVIQLFASGLGALDPQVATGAPAPATPLSQATLPITATVAGLPADVQYAGAAPGLVGLYQVNVLIPANVSPGPAGLTLNAGGNVSQDGVYITVGAK
jgi:uncharacterized protein (TIGR03437 family)